MSNSQENYIKYIIEQVANKNNLKDWNFNQDVFKTRGQNYFGVLIPIVLTGKKEGHHMSLDLVLKLAPADDRYKISGALTLFFQREIFVYSNILQKYQDIQLNFTTQLVVPKCYYCLDTDCQEVLVLENMCSRGYKPYTDDFLDLDHIIVSLRSIARFHAMSFILKEKHGTLFKTASEKCIPLNEKNNKRFMDILEDRLDKAINIFKDSEYYLSVLKKMKDNYVKYINNMAKEVKAIAICHGDIWKENILYKYENNIPVSACLIDFQTVRMCSSAYDVLYIITTSSNQELRQTNHSKLLEIYYQSFKDFLKLAGLEASEIYSWDDFKCDLKTVAPACFTIANTALWLFNGLQTEGHVRSKKILNTDEEKLAAVNNYKLLITNIIDDFVSLEYL